LSTSKTPTAPTTQLGPYLDVSGPQTCARSCEMSELRFSMRICFMQTFGVTSDSKIP